MTDYMLFVILLFIINILLAIFNRVPLLNFTVAAFTALIGTMTMADANMPFQPYASLMLIFLALICGISGVIKIKNGGD